MSKQRTTREYLASFFDRFVFHDCVVKNMKYDFKRARFVLDISLSLFEDYAEQCRGAIARLTFSRVVNITINNNLEHCIARDNIEPEWWGTFLTSFPRGDCTFLDCRVTPSKYNDFTVKNMKHECFTASLAMDFWSRVMIDFIDFDCEISNKITVEELFLVAAAYWQQDSPTGAAGCRTPGPLDGKQA